MNVSLGQLVAGIYLVGLVYRITVGPVHSLWGIAAWGLVIVFAAADPWDGPHAWYRSRAAGILTAGTLFASLGSQFGAGILTFVGCILWLVAIGLFFAAPSLTLSEKEVRR